MVFLCPDELDDHRAFVPGQGLKVYANIFLYVPFEVRCLVPVPSAYIDVVVKGRQLHGDLYLSQVISSLDVPAARWSRAAGYTLSMLMSGCLPCTH